jgi:hypothetical protein
MEELGINSTGTFVDVLEENTAVKRKKNFKRLTIMSLNEDDK